MERKLLFLFLFLIFIPAAHAQQTRIITSIEFTGNNNLKVSFLNKLTEMKAGSPLDSLEIFKDITVLKRLPAVSQATFAVVPEDDDYKLIYTLEENHTLIPQANFYTTNNEEFAYRLGLSEYNFLGRAIEVGAYYQKDIYDSYGFRFRAPFLFSNKIGIGISAKDLNILEPVFFNSSTANYKYTNTSLALNALYQLSLKHRTELGISVFTEKYKFINGATASEVIQNLDVDKFSYKMIYEYDGLNYYFQYLSGFKNRLNLQYVVSSNTILPDFLIGFNDLLYFKRVGGRGNWVDGFGWFGPLLLVLCMVAQMFLLVIPSIALMVVSILAYGPVWGSLIVLASIFTASSIGYWIGHYFGPVIVEKVIGHKAEKKIADFLEDYGFWAVIVTRLNPFLSNDAISFVGGILKMGYWRFIGATLVGIAPLTIFIAIIGKSTDALKSGLLWGSLVSLVIFGLYVYWDRKKGKK